MISRILYRRYEKASADLWQRSRLDYFSGWLRYFREYHLYKKSADSEGFALSPSYPCLTEAVESSGEFGPYIYQDSWGLKHLLDQRPAALVDIASSMYYVAFAAQVTKVISIDLRPLVSPLAGIEMRRGDITALPLENDSCEAISSLSVIEHVGLGRYGDSIDTAGMRKAAAELQRVLKPGGMLLVAFPVGAQDVVCFNAHRICTPETAIGLFGGLRLVDERYALSNALIDRVRFEQQSRPYAYGCYRFTKCPT